MAERRETNQAYYTYTLILTLLTGVLGYLAYEPALTSVRPKEEAPQSTAAWGDQQELARLWEDPLAIEGLGSTNILSSAGMRAQIDRKAGPNRRDSERTNVIILGVFIEGFPYPEDREVRVRMRYATQTALAEAGYVPEDRSHLGLMEVAWPKGAVLETRGSTNLTALAFPGRSARTPSQMAPQGLLETSTNSAATRLRIPFEWYEAETNRFPQKPQKVLVLWLKEEALADYPLQRLFLLALQIGATNSPSFAILGPWSSNTLKAVADDTELKYPTDTHYTNWLATVRLASPFASAPDALLAGSITNTDWGADRRKIKEILEQRIAVFTNFIATDDFLATNLVQELVLRGISKEPSWLQWIAHCIGVSDGQDHIVLISESDTLYGRSLPTCFAAAYCNYANSSPGLDHLLRDCWNNRSNWPTQLRTFSYLRGLDGTTAAKGEGQSAAKPGGERKANALGASSGNRAEGDAQMDYVRRLAREIKDTIGANRFGYRQPRAIGVLGSDIYDKLILLQALRPEFPDAVFFTTDLDARLLDREMGPLTRNLIVASAYGLLPGREELNGAAALPLTPFRDTYQTACRDSMKMSPFGLDENVPF
jgi:hypothetical protein